MGTIITVTSGKGGVGKSTAVGNISVGLANKGKRVVAIDFDIGLRNLDMILGLENRIVYDVIDVMENKCNLNQALINDKKAKNLFFLPASQSKDKTILDKEKVKELLDALKKQFDFVIIDSPAGIESGFEHSIFCADRALIVVNPEVSSVRDADRVIGIIDAKSDRAKAGKEVQKHLIINRIKHDLVKKGEMLDKDSVLNIVAIPLIGLISEDEKVVSATNKGEPVIYNKNSKSAKAYNNICERILGNEVAFDDGNDGFLSFFKGWFK